MPILLIGGDKTGEWNAWYGRTTPLADDLFDEHLETGGMADMSGHQKWSTLHDQLRADPVMNQRYEPMRRATADAVRLGKLRAARRKTQVQLADAIGTSQANISRIENRDDLYLSTLSHYVEALGGHLEVRAVFPDEVIVIDVGAVRETAATS